MLYLLDTNIISDLMRRPVCLAGQRLGELGATQVCTSILVVCELRFGLEKRTSRALDRRFEEVMAGLRVEPFGPPAQEHYGRIRASLTLAGKIIGSNDLLIAAHALALDATLVTDNMGEFSRVPGLAIENWLRERPTSP